MSFSKKHHYQESETNLINHSVNKLNEDLTYNGVLAIKTGSFTGRSPKDRYIVKDSLTKDKVWWGAVNIPFSSLHFHNLKVDMLDYFNDKEVFIRDSFLGADANYQVSIKTYAEYSWSDLFIRNMFIEPTASELENFKAEWVIYNAPGFKAIPEKHGTSNENFSIINFTEKIILIGGTGYTGEIKKGMFSVFNFILPIQKNVLPMHCSANVGNNGETAIFFGLSGTGKTTLSTDAKRKLIGDDEHGWTPENKIFNFEGGCYAKVINLEASKEPEIFGAIKKGALLENVIIDNEGHVDYSNSAITKNTRVSYPISHIENIQIPSIGNNPKYIFFLTADAFGVLPPMSQLTPEQAAYHFISGYTAKISGTEEGIQEPQPEFSACFGAPFMPLHPSVYANMLNNKIKETGVKVWLINTGWTGGPYGVGKRMELKYTRAMINAVLSGYFPDINPKDYHTHSVFKVAQPRKCPNVPDSVLSPRQTWNNDEAYYKKAYELAGEFQNNFKNFESETNQAIINAGPIRH
ncbi:phosphoenolpyruvate carboxykinase (ATP) [Flavivirga sp. 57AJ16]|uniref:phosphoenolpyruvate carboxykinase (ATP) n=1 Tax=Flavivirga sp. 57AJ16 TaxID=3025307 RepID=UPI002366CBDF|nr:phosphoenolpyruvate carboxykinase (ATP) [Flavivirga sp. 57AJ16]MDD7886288.1 phosphoenolpyruvate carboxykinase (ATP) [Flavivirga sp. 57AJ16]